MFRTNSTFLFRGFIGYCLLCSVVHNLVFMIWLQTNLIFFQFPKHPYLSSWSRRGDPSFVSSPYEPFYIIKLVLSYWILKITNNLEPWGQPSLSFPMWPISKNMKSPQTLGEVGNHLHFSDIFWGVVHFVNNDNALLWRMSDCCFYLLIQPARVALSTRRILISISTYFSTCWAINWYSRT